jgi:hypothetical protein
MSTTHAFTLWHVQYYGIQFIASVLDLGAQRRFERRCGFLGLRKIPGFYKSVLLFFLVFLEAQTSQYRVTIFTKSLEKLLV